jgi:hypothetical protein
VVYDFHLFGTMVSFSNQPTINRESRLDSATITSGGLVRSFWSSGRFGWRVESRLAWGWGWDSSERQLRRLLDDLGFAFRGTPDAGLKVVSQNADRIMDCKDDERNALSGLIAALFETL